MNIADKLAQIATNTIPICEAMDEVRKSLSGSTVMATDVCDVQHDIPVKIRRKNLIPYPYAEKTKTQNGVTFSDNGDGTITLNGTATANTPFFLNYGFYLPVDGTYTVSGCPAGGSFSTYLLCLNYWDANGVEMGAPRDTGNGGKITLQANTWSSLYIYIYSGTTFSNLTFKPQLELGTTATSYTPYVENLEAVKIKKYGKNLVSFYPTPSGRTDIVITVKEDGECIFNGTATSDFIATRDGKTFPLNLPRNAYTFSLNNSVGIGTGTFTDSPYIALRGKSSDGMPWFTSAKLNNPNTTAEVYKTHPLFDTTNLCDVLFVIPKGVTVNNFSIKPQLELGNVATEYEPYSMEYVGDAFDSTPNITTLIPDTSGVILDVKYFPTGSEDMCEAKNELTAAIKKAKALI